MSLEKEEHHDFDAQQGFLAAFFPPSSSYSLPHLDQCCEVCAIILQFLQIFLFLNFSHCRKLFLQHDSLLSNSKKQLHRLLLVFFGCYYFWGRPPLRLFALLLLASSLLLLSVFGSALELDSSTSSLVGSALESPESCVSVKNQSCIFSGTQCGVIENRWIALFRTLCRFYLPFFQFFKLELITFRVIHG